MGRVDVNVEGTYELTYTVTDSDGNRTESKREVVVRPIKVEINNAPTIEANDKIIKVGTEFNPLSDVTAFDAEDGDITNKVMAKIINILRSLLGTTSFIILLVIKGYTKSHRATVNAANISSINNFLYGL